MEIIIDKKKAWKRIVIGEIINAVILFVIGYISIRFIHNLFDIEYSINKIYWYGLLILIIIKCWNLVYNWLWLRSVVYQAEPDKLTETYTLLTKSRNQARLQVVNDVNFNQSIMDRLFGLFNLDVTYGFGDEGYSFTYQYLSEKKANELSDFIKAKGKVIDLK
ncbi:MAG: PH domain-containing protein [Nanoarchaeota archaeon]